MPLSVPPFVGGGGLWPSASDLQQFMAVNGYGSISGPDAQRYVASAVAEWEAMTGWSPFLSSGTEETRSFDPPRYSAHGFRLEIGAWRTIATVEIGGRVLESGEYVLRNVSIEPEPVYAVDFLVSVGGGPLSIEITGERGFCDNLPDDVFQAVLGKAAYDASASSVSGATRLSSVQQGDVKYSYDADAVRTLQTRFLAAVARYARV